MQGAFVRMRRPVGLELGEEVLSLKMLC